ncbi:hypothetical protein [Halomarina pelagica]|uniref:hypothetical protein n=1 Tax=Halomarina pelagica TaxID=2961599 RepID=UPI0020C2C775|nr:hypothetical protein [Halomarina sp. BND7]
MTTSGERRGSDRLLVVAVLTLAVAVRLLPLAFSPLPFNPDGFAFAGKARAILAANQLTPGGGALDLAPDEYLFTALLAALSSVTGVPPRFVAQAQVAVVAAVPPLVAVALARDLAGARGLSVPTRRVAAAAAGCGLAVEGLYLWRTTTVSSEVQGLSFVALLGLALYRGVVRSSRRWTAVAVALLALLPFTHNLSTTVAGLVLTVYLATAAARRPRLTLPGTALVIGFWVYAFGYYRLAGLREIGRFTSSPGLSLAWVVLIVALAYWLTTTSPRVQRGVPNGLLFAGLGVFAVNAVVPIYPGSVSTDPLMLALMLPLVAVAAMAAWALPQAARAAERPVLALTLAPVAVIGIGLTAGLTVDYQGMVTRSQTFMHLGVLVLAGVFVARVVGNRRRAVRVAVAALFVVSLVATVPFPYTEHRTKPYQAITYPPEFEAATFAAERVPHRWAGDDHVVSVAVKYTGAEATDLAVAEWLGGDAPPPTCAVVAQRSWTTVGAQSFPRMLRMEERAYERWLAREDVVYAVSGPDPLHVVAGREGCEPMPLAP